MNERSTAIAFVGFMGAGKSSAARAVARELDLPLVDTDELVAARAGKPIAALFAAEGEARFREIEEEVVLEALERGGVVALGGGAVESERVRDALGDHVTVWCKVEDEVAWARCAGSDRPLARDRDGFFRRHRARLPLYSEVARVHLPTSGQALPPVAPWLAALRVRPELSMIWASTPGGEYPAVVGPGATAVYEDEGVPRPGARTFAVVDRAAAAADGSLVPGIVQPVPIEIEGGERSKTLDAAESVLVALVDAGVRRDDALLAFGGGVTGDLAGFCAAVFQRGMPIVQVPTTLVAQVDSAYGGKTGVDMPQAKNYVGAFHQPAAVLADPAALRTLPPEELAAGFAEVVKTALIDGGPLWERVRRLDRIDAEAVAPLVFDCARTKIDVVAEDERDSGRRAVLNLGHTVGHAIEAATSYGRYRHGEAVALGMLAALRLSGRDELRDEVAGLLALAGLPTALDAAVGVDDVIAACERDKKRTAAGLGFVLVDAPGTVVHGRSVEPGSLRAAVTELQES